MMSLRRCSLPEAKPALHGMVRDQTRDKCACGASVCHFVALDHRLLAMTNNKDLDDN